MTVKNELLRGYPALIGAFLGIAIGINSLYFYTTGMFVKPLQEEFDATRGAISSINFVGALVSAGIAPFVGALTDRFGVRLVGGICLLGFSCGFYLVSGASNFTEFFIFALILQIVGTGTSPIVFSRLVNQHFDKIRGFALGLSLAGTGLTGAFAPRFLAGFIEDNGWRQAYQVLALIVIIFTPIVIILAGKKIKKESLEGDKASGGTQSKEVVEYGVPLVKARRSPTLWLLGAMFFFVSIAIGGLILHFVPLLTDAGVPLKTAASIAGALGISVVIGRVGIGLLLDRFFAPYVAMLLFAITAIGLLLLAFGGAQFAIIAAICIGCSIGGETDLIAYFTARYFGMRSYGKIYGIVYAMFTLGMSFSAVLVGVIYDTQGSYFMALLASASFLVIGCLICSRLPAFPEFNRNP
jgi:MFS family permease